MHINNNTDQLIAYQRIKDKENTVKNIYSSDHPIALFIKILSTAFLFFLTTLINSW